MIYIIGDVMKFLFLLLPLLLFGDIDLARSMIKQHEGFRSTPYIDCNHFSVGYGTNLKYGITKTEAELLLNYRLLRVHSELNQYSWYYLQSPLRQAVLLDMGYNLGVSKLLKFRTMIWCLDKHFYHAAANAMRRSLWCKQVGSRCKDLCNIMWFNELNKGL